MVAKEIISEITTRDAFFHLLKNNPGLVILKLGAEWCGPCKQIKHIVHAFFATSPSAVVCGDIDVDKSFDFYSMLKSKKMVNGVPVILCYKKGNQSCWHRKKLPKTRGFARTACSANQYLTAPIRYLIMGTDRDGFARNARLRKAEPTSSERLEFKLVMFAFAVVLGVFSSLAIIGVSMILWRIWG